MVGIAMCSMVMFTPLSGCQRADPQRAPAIAVSPPVQSTVLHLVVETAVSVERASIVIIWRAHGTDAIVQLETRADGQWRQVFIKTVPVAADVIATTDRLRQLEYEQPEGPVTSDGPLCTLSTGPEALVQCRSVELMRDSLLSLGLKDVCDAFCGTPKSLRIPGICVDEANPQRLPVSQTE